MDCGARIDRSQFVRDQLVAADFIRHLNFEFLLGDQVMIDPRFVVVDGCLQIEDWEMDTVIGKPGGSVVVTMTYDKGKEFALHQLP